MAGLVELATPTIEADPGEESEVGILVYNTGVDDEAYDLQVIGPPATWSFLDPSVVRLPGGGSGIARLVMRPPRTADIPAGPMPFSILLSPRAHHDQDEVAEGTLDIAPYEAFTARLVPDVVDVALRARTRIEVTNDGNVPIVVNITPSSPDDALHFRADEETVLVPAGATTDILLRLRAHNRRLIGRGDAALFTVRLESLARVATLSGRVRPKGTLFALAARGVLAVAVVAGLALAWQHRPVDGGPKRDAKGLPVVLASSPPPTDPLLNGITGIEEPSPSPATSAPADPTVTVAQAPVDAGSTPGTLPTPPPEIRGQARAAAFRRFYDPALVDYVYTADTNEANRLLGAGYVEQGAAGSVLTARSQGTVPLYRLRRPDGHHVFTFDEAERKGEVVKGAAVQEGIAGYLFPNPAAGTQPLYRMEKGGVLYLTADNGDVQARLANGWVNQGVRGYVLVG